MRSPEGASDVLSDPIDHPKGQPEGSSLERR